MECSLGIVGGHAIVSTQGLEGWFSSTNIKKEDLVILGGRMAEARKQALVKLKSEALKLYANGVVGIAFSQESYGVNATRVVLSATGTAVKLRKRSRE